MKHILTLFIFISTLAAPVSAGHLFLKNGEVINGGVSETTDAGIVFTDESGNKKAVERKNILRVSYKTLTLKPVYIYLHDGSVTRAIQVGEEQNFVIFRNKLNSSDEFPIARKEIKFISPEKVKTKVKIRLAVLDLTPKEVSPDAASSISDIIRSELIKSGNFAVVERSQVKDILKEQGLAETGAIKGDEEIKIGRHLAAQRLLIMQINLLDNNYIITIRVVDVERGISEFSVKERSGTLEGLKKTAAHTAQGLSFRLYKKPQQLFDFSGGLAGGLPLGSLSNLSSFGIGAYFRFIFNPVAGFSLGLDFSFLYYFPTTAVTNSLMMMPLRVSIGYRFDIRDLYLRPYIFAGGSFIILTQVLFNQNTTTTGMDFITGGGLDIGYNITESVYIELGASYQMLFEGANLMHHIDIKLGAGYRM